jgi:DNA mismatch endonuclease Vsr
MSRIRSKDTSIEVILSKAMWHKGYRYRKNYKELPGTPDIVLTKNRIAIFCDSEFFHGKDWGRLKLRLENGNNITYWIKKLPGTWNVTGKITTRCSSGTGPFCVSVSGVKISRITRMNASRQWKKLYLTY